MSNTNTIDNQIAIIGLSGRFPYADGGIEQFWQNLRNGVEAITYFSDQELLASGVSPGLLTDPSYVKSAMMLNGVELFDASFFGFTPREAEIMNPQHRVFLECAWEALEVSGYVPEMYEGRIGIYAGAGSRANEYIPLNKDVWQNLARSVGDVQIYLTNEREHLVTYTSYKLNLKGPGVNVQTACSTSLVAVHFACQSLLSGECDIALAGGIRISIPQKEGYLYQEGGILSPDGHCRAFDANARGTASGDGVGIIVLKRLADALTDGDTIHAIIRGSAINNDGASKVGYTAPSVEGQTEVIMEALALAGVEAETISYVETHGTGTPLGDPIEIAALTKAFRASTPAQRFCAIGSVKTNIGHLDAAAGIAGLIKLVLALKYKELPPSLHFEQPNPQIDFANSPFYVNSTLSPWQPDQLSRRAGVSSFGIGGTNAHVILEEAPPSPIPSPARHWQLLVLSAKTDSALKTAARHLSRHLREQPDLNLADVAYTLQVGRKAFKHRMMLVCRTLEDAVPALETLHPQHALTGIQAPLDRTVAFLFPGQGTHYVHMTQELYQQEPTFRKQVDLCIGLLRPLVGFDLREVLYPAERDSKEAAQRLKQTNIAQPALFVVEYSMARLLMEWGIYPQSMIGHSIGEYVAACLAGVFTLEEALRLIAVRGSLMQQLPGGSMLAVALSEQEISYFLSTDLSLAAINAPAQCVVSGPAEAVTTLQNQLLAQGVQCHQLYTSHAFHSRMMGPVLGIYGEYVAQVRLNPPQIPYISNVTGTWITAAETTDPAYWTRHLRQTVHFARGIHELLQNPDCVLLEVGPGQALSTLARQNTERDSGQLMLTSVRPPQSQQSDLAYLLHTLGRLWLVGAQVSWPGFYTHESRLRIPLPTYPFERQRYWIDRQTPAYEGGNRHFTHPDGIEHVQQDPLSPRQEDDLQSTEVPPLGVLEDRIVDIWQDLLGIQRIGIHDDFFELGGHSVLAIQLVSRLRDTCNLDVSVQDIFEAPTVAGLTRVIEQKQIEQAESGVLAQMLAEIEQLSEDELQTILALEKQSDEEMRSNE